MRRRHKLQVSTFPFLAVLLCAMGSLILVLLIFDRRAQSAARTRVALKAAEQQRCADDAVAARAEEERERRAAWQARQDKTKADWEAEQQRIHDNLLAEQVELRQHRAEVASQKDEAAAAVRAEEERAAELRRQLAVEQDRLLADEKTLTSRKSEEAQAAEQKIQQKAGLAQAEGDLISLEETVKAIKAARAKEASTFSVVPYRGKHGDSRRPLYVECTAQGLIFHPDKLKVAFPTIPDRANPQALGDALTRTRDEVLRRVAQQRAASAPGTEATGGYLLFLVRPDGIITYDLTQAALRGQAVEFGYEFVEADWVFEFPAEGQPATQPWMTAHADNPPEVGIPFPRTVAGGAGNGTGQPGVAPQSSGSNGQSGSSGPGLPPGLFSGADLGMTSTGTNVSGASQSSGAGNGAAGFGTPRYQAVNLGGEQGPGPGGAGSGTNGAPGTGASTGLAEPGLPDNRLAGNLGGSLDGRAGPGSPNGSASGPNTAGPAKGDSQGVSGSLIGNGLPIGVLPTGNSGGVAAVPPNTDGAMPHSPPASIGGTSKMPELFARDVPTPANMRTGNPDSSPNGSDSPLQMPQVLPALPTQNARPGGTAESGGNAPAGQGQAAQASGPYTGQPATGGGNAAHGDASPSGSPAGGGSSGDGSGTGPNLSLPTPTVPKLAGQAAPRPAAQTPRPVRLAGDRQWILFVECRADGVVLHPSLRSFSAANLALPQGLADLTRAAQMLLERRQSMANQLGEQAFKVQIRFLVWPDGERTYHTVYPALDILPAPKTWQMLRPGDDVDHMTSS